MLNLTEAKIRDIDCYQVNDTILLPGMEELGLKYEAKLFIERNLVPIPTNYYPPHIKPNLVCWSVFHQYRNLAENEPWLDDNIAGIYESEFEYEWFGTTEREIRDFYQID